MKTSDCCSSEPDVYLAKVQKINASYDPSCSAPEPKYDVPFYDELTPNADLIIPKEGEVFFLSVESATRWHQGQWVELEGVGRFPVVSIIDAKKMVLLNNGYNTNLSPGSSFRGQRKLWPVPASLLSLDAEAVARLNEQIKLAEFQFSPYLVDSKETENGFAVAAIEASAACEPCAAATKSAAGDSRPVKVFKNIIFKFLTIALPRIASITGVSKTFKKSGENVTLPYRRLVIDPENGDIYAKRAPSAPAIEYYDTEQTQYALVPADYATKFYVLSANKSTKAPQWRQLNIKSPVWIGSELTIGSVNFKSIVQAALGIELPNAGEMIVTIFSKLEAAEGEATFDGEIVCKTGVDDDYASGTRSFRIDLSSPSKTIAGTYFMLETAFVDASHLLNA